MIDIDPGTAAVLRSWKKERGTLALALARDDALVFGDLEGGYLASGAVLADVQEHAGAVPQGAR